MPLLDASATAGSSATICEVFRGGDMNIGWFEFGLVARATGEIGLNDSVLGVRLGVVLMVGGVLSVEMEEVEVER